MFTLSIETNAGTYQHPAHLGSEERTARSVAEEIYTHRIPKIGDHIVTVALMRDGRLWDCFDGRWTSDIAEELFAA